MRQVLLQRGHSLAEEGSEMHTRCTGKYLNAI